MRVKQFSNPEGYLINLFNGINIKKNVQVYCNGIPATCFAGYYFLPQIKAPIELRVRN